MTGTEALVWMLNCAGFAFVGFLAGGMVCILILRRRPDLRRQVFGDR